MITFASFASPTWPWSAKAIQALDRVSSHVVIEAHPGVAKRFLDDFPDQAGNTHILTGFWEDVTPLLADNSFARQAYGRREISERHRHRYEFNREYEAVLKQHGLRLTGETPDGVYVEICELAEHPWYLGCQFHPEFKSKPHEPHPLFRSFIGAALLYRNRKTVSQPTAQVVSR